ncbi:MAG: NAD-dependent epimerase/dehydratase family protein [Candidatus Hodarchaeota archaeon]
MKILITGGAGFIGSHLVESIAKQGNEIMVLDDFSTGTHNLSLLKSLKNVTVVEGTISNSHLVDNVVSNCSIIYHLAAMNRAQRSIENPLAAHEVNITGTLNILEAARRYDIEGIVFASSSSVYGSSKEFPRREDNSCKPIHPYAVGKLASEHYCIVYYHLYGLNVKILRYFAVYGPRQSPMLPYAAVIPIFIKKAISKKKLTIFGDGTQRRNFTFVEDTVQATIAAMKSLGATGRILNIANENEISLNEVISILERISGHSLQVTYEDWRLGDIKRAPADISSCKEILGIEPTTTIADGIKKTYEWNLKNPRYFIT